MSPERRRDVQSVFEEMVPVPREHRAEALARRCGNDQDLRQIVERYLSNLDRMGGFLETPVFEDEREVPAGVPIRVGRYAIVRKIEGGGMGLVYEARQQEPQRTVALKVIAPGLTSSDMLRRFKLEADVLGQLQHPGIAQIYEAGTAELVFSHTEPSGETREIRTAPQPFFAMEFVKGQKLDDYAAAHALNIRQRLELVAGICDAVQHAHQKGVIHRDLKPSNILVVAQSAAPKILDFGVARLTGSDMQTVTLHTEAGLLLGTIPYMSPEQVLGDPAQIDTRSDVYALGVILYELLAERLPIDVRNVAVPEAARRIRQDEPARLSTAHASLRGDVETIVAKAIEKDRERRYQSAGDLSADIRRYLTDEPILARPASNLYKIRKFARRNRGFVVAASLLIAALVTGTVVSLRLYWRAEIARRGEADQRDLAQRRAVEAEKQTARVGAVNSAFKDILAAAAPDQMGYDVKLVDALAGASKTMEDRFQNEPDLAAEAMLTLADTYRDIGMFDASIGMAEKASSLLEKSEGPDSVLALSARGSLAESYRAKGDLDRCRAIAEEALKRADAAQPGDHYLRGRLLTAVGATLQASRQHDKAQPMLREAIGLLDQKPEYGADALNARSELGASLMASGKLADAEVMFREILARGKTVFRKPHPLILATMNNLCVVLSRQNRVAESLPIAREMLQTVNTVFPENHPSRGFASLTFANLLRRSNEFDEAQQLAVQAVSIFQHAFGYSHYYTQQAVKIASDIYRDAGKTSAFAAWQYDWIAAWLGSAGPSEANDIAKSFKSLQSISPGPSTAPAADSLLLRLRNDVNKLHPAGDAHRARYLGNLGRLARATNDDADAASILLEAQSALKDSEHSSEESKFIAEALVDVYTAMQQPDEAARWRRQLAPPSAPTSQPG